MNWSRRGPAVLSRRPQRSRLWLHRRRSSCRCRRTPRPCRPRLEAAVSDAYFDYDKSDIRDDARTTLAKDAAALRSILADFPNAVIVLEGHCDDRGSAEYNLGMGELGAASASAYLEGLGVETGRLQRISHGKEKPVCTESSEACWQKNRRVHFAAGASGAN